MILLRAWDPLNTSVVCEYVHLAECSGWSESSTTSRFLDNVFFFFLNKTLHVVRRDRNQISNWSYVSVSLLWYHMQTIGETMNPVRLFISGFRERKLKYVTSQNMPAFLLHTTYLMYWIVHCVTFDIMYNIWSEKETVAFWYSSQNFQY